MNLLKRLTCLFKGHIIPSPKRLARKIRRMTVGRVEVDCSRCGTTLFCEKKRHLVIGDWELLGLPDNQ